MNSLPFIQNLLEADSTCCTMWTTSLVWQSLDIYCWVSHNQCNTTLLFCPSDSSFRELLSNPLGRRPDCCVWTQHDSVLVHSRDREREWTVNLKELLDNHRPTLRQQSQTDGWCWVSKRGRELVINSLRKRPNKNWSQSLNWIIMCR